MLALFGIHLSRLYDAVDISSLAALVEFQWIPRVFAIILRTFTAVWDK